MNRRFLLESALTLLAVTGGMAGAVWVLDIAGVLR